MVGGRSFAKTLKQSHGKESIKYSILKRVLLFIS